MGLFDKIKSGAKLAGKVAGQAITNDLKKSETLSDAVSKLGEITGIGTEPSAQLEDGIPGVKIERDRQDEQDKH